MSASGRPTSRNAGSIAAGRCGNAVSCSAPGQGRPLRLPRQKSGVPQIAADLLHRPTWQPWANSRRAMTPIPRDWMEQHLMFFHCSVVNFRTASLKAFGF
jgi:hypothetical protein